MRKNRPLNGVQYQLARVVQNRIGIKDNPGSSSLESATVIIFRTTLTPTIIIIVRTYEATPGFKSTPQMIIEYTCIKDKTFLGD